MSKKHKRRTRWYLWPFKALWDLVLFIFSLTGRLVVVVLGLALVLTGVLLSLTVVGAIIGVPLAIFGLMLVVRGLW